MFPVEASTKHPKVTPEPACLTLVGIKDLESRRTKKAAGKGTEAAFCKQNLPPQLHFHKDHLHKREERWGKIGVWMDDSRDTLISVSEKNPTKNNTW